MGIIVSPQYSRENWAICMQQYLHLMESGALYRIRTYVLIADVREYEAYDGSIIHAISQPICPIDSLHEIVTEFYWYHED
jgi:hypothetical protein